jgi:hypothetical protein
MRKYSGEETIQKIFYEIFISAGKCGYEGGR